jgi:HrpA-like RNA helicase
MFAALPVEKQAKVFEPAPLDTRKVILATNIAETSITINGVRYVIDTGKFKMRKFSPKIGMESLSIENVSKNSAKQRMGRAGREVCDVLSMYFSSKGGNSATC